MDSFEINKIVAAILVVFLVVFGIGKISDMVFHVEKPNTSAYKVEVSTVSSTQESTSNQVVDIAGLLAMGDLDHAKKVWKKCSACHAFDSGGKNKVGPALWNIVNRQMGASNDYAYSDALASFGGVWDYQSLNAFLAKPKVYIAGTKMNFGGLKKSKDRANLIAWMRVKADKPVSLPTADDIAADGVD